MAHLGARATDTFVRAFAAGLVTCASESGQRRWSWVYRGKEADLGRGATAAMGAWACLPEGLAGPLDEAARETLGHGDPARARLDTARKLLGGWRFDAEADGQLSEAQALGRLIQALEQAREALGR